MNNKNKYTKIETGKKIEELAAKYLINNNLQIIERNFSCKFGETEINYRFDVVTGQGPLNNIKIDWFIGSFVDL